MAILPLAGYFTFTQRFPLLPSWYTEYYTQEDRLKQVALILQRQTEWTGLAMDKVNEVVDILNETGQVDVSDFLNQINTVAGNIETIFSELETIEELISEVDRKTTANTDKVSSLNTQVLAINAKIVQVEELISNNSSSISSVSGRVSTLETNLSDLNTRTASVEGSVSTVNTELVSVSQDISNIQDAITNVNSSVSDLITRVDSLENSSGGGVDPALEGRVEAVETTVNAHTGSISVLNTRVDTHSEDISGLNTRVDTLESSSGGGGGDTDPALEGRVVKLETTVGTYPGTLSDLNNQIIMNTQDISGLNTRVEAVENAPGGGGGGEGGGGTIVEVIPDPVYEGINIKTDGIDNYFTIGSFGGTIDVSLEGDPENRGGSRINLEAKPSGGGGTSLIKQFGKQLYPGGNISLLKDDNIIMFEEVVSEYGISEDGDNSTLYGTTSSNKLYVYDEKDSWVIGQADIMSDFDSAESFTGRYIPLILDKNIPDNVKVYWDGETAGTGERIYKFVFDLATAEVNIKDPQFNIAINDIDTLGSIAIQNVESTAIATESATYAPSAFSFGIRAVEPETIVGTLNLNLEDEFSSGGVFSGKLIISFIKF